MSTSKIPVHDYEPSLQDTVRLANSDVFFYHGLNLEPWVEGTLSILGSDAPPAYATHTMPSGEVTPDYQSLLVSDLCAQLSEGDREFNNLIAYENLASQLEIHLEKGVQSLTFPSADAASLEGHDHSDDDGHDDHDDHGDHDDHDHHSDEDQGDHDDHHDEECWDEVVNFTAENVSDSYDWTLEMEEDMCLGIAQAQVESTVEYEDGSTESMVVGSFIAYILGPLAEEDQNDDGIPDCIGNMIGDDYQDDGGFELEDFAIGEDFHAELVNVDVTNGTCLLYTSDAADE